MKKPTPSRSMVVGICGLFLATFGIWQIGSTVLAEQRISTPESGANSRIKTIFDSLVSLGYGSDIDGSWGNWGNMWNRIYSAATTPFNDAIVNQVKNGGNTNFPQSVGGVDDYNFGNTIPSDSYQADWLPCTIDNQYCGTDRSVAEAKDTNTRLVWSPQVSVSSTWFTANNCQYPNGLPGDDGVCNQNGEVACLCVKRESNKTGCEGYDDGNWRLPTQKELMMAYVDGARANLITPLVSAYHWTSTTSSNSTHIALRHSLLTGLTLNNIVKTTSLSVRCIRN